MVDLGKLKIGKNGLVTTESLISFLLYCNSEERGDAFCHLVLNEEMRKKYPMNHKTYYIGLTNAYDSGNIPPIMARSLFIELFGEDCLNYCTKKDKDFYKSIKTDENGFVTLYRGCSKDESMNDVIKGISWTTNRGVAEFFAFRFGQKGVVVSTKIPKTDIVTVLTDRCEDECIVTEIIDDFEIVTDKPTEYYAQYLINKK